MKQTFKKGVLFVLALVMVFGVYVTIPFTAFAANDDAVGDEYYKIISKNDYQLAPGIMESDLVFNNDEGTQRQVVHVVEVDINNPYTKVMPSYMGMKENIIAGKYTTATMDKQAAYAEANGYGNVVAAMNLSLSWYSSTYYAEHPELVGEPLGYLFMDGVKYENSRGPSSGAETCLVINFDEKDGVSRPEGIPKAEVRLTTSPITGWEEQVIPANFEFIVKDGKNLQKENHTSGFGPKSIVGVKADGTIVMMMCDGRQDPYSAGLNTYEAADYMISLGCVNVIRGDGGGSSQFLTQRPGEELELHCSPSDGAARSTTHGILVITTAPATGEFVRATISTENKFYTPGSEVTFKALGSDAVGTYADIPEEAFWRLEDSSMGSIDEKGVFTSNGKIGDVTAQLVYNDEVVGEATISIVIPEIALKTSKLVLPYGQTTEIKLMATTNGGLNTVALKEGDIVLTLSDPAMGTVNGTSFTTTSDTSVTGGQITAVVCGNTENAITFDVTFGKASEIAYDFEDPSKFIIDTSNAGGASDADTTGEYYYGWHIADKGVTKYYGYRTHSKTTSSNSKFGLGVLCDLAVVDRTSGMVRNGDYAMAVDIDYSQVTSTGATQVCMWLPESLDVSEATSVGVWVYFPDVENLGESMYIAWTGKKTDGKNANVNTGITIGGQFDGKQGFSDEGWYYISIDTRANDMVTLDYLTFMSYDTANTQINSKSDYTFYLDDFTVDYSDAVIDRENPYFTGVYVVDSDTDKELVDGQTIYSNTVSFSADVTENMDKDNYSGLDFDSLAVSVDGVRITDGVYVTNGGRITVTDLYLTDGVHTLRLAIRDEQGNEGSVVRKVVINNKKGDVHFELEKPNFANVPTGAVVYLNLIAKNISEIESITTKVRLDGTSTWDLEGMEVAYGFTAVYTVNDNNEAFITFTRVSDDVADTDVLAKLPLRAWVASAYLNPLFASKVSNNSSQGAKGYILTPKAMWSGGSVTKMHIIADASEGIITYADGSTGMFSSETYEITTEMNKHHGEIVGDFTDHTQGKTSFHIHKSGEKTSKDATCWAAGYIDRVFCVGCTCDTEGGCDTANGCGSVVEWGTTVPATGHKYEIKDGKLTCVNGGELFNGVYTDGKTYVDGVVIADGWNADNTAYYLDGVKITGSYWWDGKMYTFDENGTYLPNYIYEGEYAVGDTIMYFIAGKYLTGEQIIANDAYYFDTNGLGYDGEYIICGETCVFDNGRYASCSTANLLDAGWCGKNAGYVVYADGTLYIGGSGSTYQYENHGNRPFIDYLKQIKKVVIGKDITILNLNICSYLVATEVVFEEGSKLENISTGAFLSMQRLASINIPESVKSIGAIAFKNCIALRKIGVPTSVNNISSTAFKGCSSSLVFFIDEGSAAEKFAKANGFATTTESIVKNGFVEEDGEIYYYVDGVKWTRRGVFKVGDDFYYAKNGGALVRSQKIYATITNDLVPFDMYEFDESGKMLIKNGFVEEDGEIYYYVDGVKWTRRGVFEVGDDFYYAKNGGALLRNTTAWASVTNDLLPKAQYQFDENGKILIK